MEVFGEKPFEPDDAKNVIILMIKTAEAYSQI